MELLENIYKIKKPQIIDYPCVDFPEFALLDDDLVTNITVNKTFGISHENLDVSHESIDSIFWHFGDPFSPTPEKITRSLDETVSNVYTKPGIYTVNCIIVASEYIIHITKKVSILTQNTQIFSTTVSGEEYNNITIYCYDPKAIIWYKLPTDSEYHQYSGTIQVPSDTGGEYILYYGQLSDMSTTQVYFDTFADTSINFYNIDGTPFNMDTVNIIGNSYYFPQNPYIKFLIGSDIINGQNGLDIHYNLSSFQSDSRYDLFRNILELNAHNTDVEIVDDIRYKKVILKYYRSLIVSDSYIVTGPTATINIYIATGVGVDYIGIDQRVY